MAKLSPSVLKRMVDATVADFIENALAKMEEESYKELHETGDDLLKQLAECQKEHGVSGGSESSTFPRHDPLPARRSSVGISSGFLSSLRGNGAKLRLKERLEHSFHLGFKSKRQNAKRQRTTERRKRRSFGLHRFFGT